MKNAPVVSAQTLPTTMNMNHDAKFKSIENKKVSCADVDESHTRVKVLFTAPPLLPQTQTCVPHPGDPRAASFQ